MRISSLKRFVARLMLLTFVVCVPVAPSPRAAAQRRAAQAARITESFDKDWRFLKSDARGAEGVGFDDSSWRNLDVPHDWSIEGPFDEKNPTGGAGGFLPAGVGWYRKHFTLPASASHRHVFIDFDGIMANSDVWINGFHLGHRPYGYVSFRYELTGQLNFGSDKQNVLAVRADNSGQPASRWYTGAGLYRHVRLVITDPVHIEHWSTFVTTPKVEVAEATVRVESTVVNHSDAPRNASLHITLLDPDGRAIQNVSTKAQEIAAGKSVDFRQEIAVRSPKIWDIDHPYIYRAVTQVRAGRSTLDDETTTFGIREFHFDAATDRKSTRLNSSHANISYAV